MKTPFWTHPSISKLTKDEDPVGVITRLARDLVLRAIDQGWTGPPYDPVILASLLEYRVIPREDILDARTVPLEHGQIQIEFNPNKPKGRLRYSIAHEIAHTLFPDCKEMVRHRLARENMKEDDWQLELLCNIAASELLMPIGSFPDLKQSELSIDALMDLRRKFDVSTEAILLRMVRLTDHPCFVFCASRREREGPTARYTIDYTVASRNWNSRLLPGTLLPTASVVRECTAIGFTAKADESWPSIPGVLHVEAVGIPSYPGHRFPRVVGIGTQPRDQIAAGTSILYLKGDATRPRGDGMRIIAHVVNDRAARWGGGFALAMRRHFPQVQEAFIEWSTSHKAEFRLGSSHLCIVDSELAVANMICQHGYGPSRAPRIRYGALESCLKELAVSAKARNASIHMPRIGCGQAGGSWEVVGEMIEDYLCNEGIPVTVYALPEQRVAPSEKQTGLFNE